MFDIRDRLYFDEVYYLMKHMNRRKLGEYRMQLALIQNPHTKNPKELWDQLKIDQHIRPAELDSTGFDLLRARMQQGQGFNVK
jgi:hypothetical protein